MTPKRPFEVSQASKDISSAWDKYDAFIESGDNVGAKAAWEALGLIEERYSTMYRQWQELGGTSDIETIALSATERNWQSEPVKVTVSRSWAELHLNTDVNGFEAELDKAFGVGKWILK